MTADMTFGRPMSLFRGHAPRGAHSLRLRDSPERLSRTWTCLRDRRISSSQAVDRLAYASEGLIDDSMPCESHDTAAVGHDRTIFELSDDPSDDHWALTPEQIGGMTWNEASDTP